MTLGSTARAELRPPTSDVYGDSVRVLRWDPPLEIPQLSRTARRWLQSATGRALPGAIADAVYAERAARVGGLVRSDDVSQLLALRSGIDVLRPLPHPREAPALSFQHVFVFASGEGASVERARLSASFSRDGTGITALVSSLEPDLAPPSVALREGEAVEAAYTAVREHGSFEVAEVDPTELVVERAALPLAGARPSTLVRRANDRVTWLVRLVDVDRPTRVVQVSVDAATGGVADVRLLSGDGPSSPSTSSPKEHWLFAGLPLVVRLAALGRCRAFDGLGVDTDGLFRGLSTTWYPPSQLPTETPFALVSCNESLERHVNAEDLITLRSTPSNESGLDLVQVFRDNDDVWAGVDPDVPQAVSAHFWGERALRFFKSRGYETRSTGDPVRFIAHYRPGAAPKDFAEFTPWLGGNPPYKGNGIIRLNGPGAVFETPADPAVLTHELAHSLSHDLLGGIPNPATEAAAVEEGLADCFAMVAMNAYMNEQLTNPAAVLPPGYATLGEEAPFHLWAGSYKDTGFSGWGYPNLATPNNSYGPLGNIPATTVPYTYWSGQRVDAVSPLWPQMKELNSTLFGGVCKLLVTGGTQPVLGASLIQTFAGVVTSNSLGASATGAVDRQLAYERLERLLLYTALYSKTVPSTFYDMIEVLSANAHTLASTEWQVSGFTLEERVRRAFAEYGFGRSLEHEPNDAGVIDAGGDAARRNLIATGGHDFRDISGSLCSGDEDFFPVNERVKEGDSIQFNFKLPPQKVPADSPVFEVRFYRTKPCDFPAPSTTLDSCAKQYQVYPTVDENGLVPGGTPPLQSKTFEFPKPQGSVEPPPVSPYRKLFVGVRLKEGTCDSPYTLHVGIQRQKEIYP